MLYTDPTSRPFAKDPAVVRFHDRYYLYYSQMQEEGPLRIAIAVSDDMDTWEKVALLPLDQPCEANGVGAPGAIVLNGRVHLFYQTYGNWEKDALCHAVSEDGVFFRRLFHQPFLSCGKPGAWNASESGHPYAFRDDDGRCYLFYQGSPDSGKSWYLSKVEIGFVEGKPIILT